MTDNNAIHDIYNEETITGKLYAYCTILVMVSTNKIMKFSCFMAKSPLKNNCLSATSYFSISKFYMSATGL